MAREELLEKWKTAKDVQLSTVLDLALSDATVYRFGRLVITSVRLHDVGLVGSKEPPPALLETPSDTEVSSLASELASMGLPTTFGKKTTSRRDSRREPGPSTGTGRLGRKDRHPYPVKGSSTGAYDSDAGEPAADTPWLQGFDERWGCHYYYNTLTQESVWEAPAEGFTPWEDAAASKAAADATAAAAPADDGKDQHAVDSRKHASPTAAAAAAAALRGPPGTSAGGAQPGIPSAPLDSASQAPASRQPPRMLTEEDLLRTMGLLPEAAPPAQGGPAGAPGFEVIGQHGVGSAVVPAGGGDRPTASTYASAAAKVDTEGTSGLQAGPGAAIAGECTSLKGLLLRQPGVQTQPLQPQPAQPAQAQRVVPPTALSEEQLLAKLAAAVPASVVHDGMPPPPPAPLPPPPSPPPPLPVAEPVIQANAGAGAAEPPSSHPLSQGTAAKQRPLAAPPRMLTEEDILRSMGLLTGGSGAPTGPAAAKPEPAPPAATPAPTAHMSAAPQPQSAAVAPSDGPPSTGLPASRAPAPPPGFGGAAVQPAVDQQPASGATPGPAPPRPADPQLAGPGHTGEGGRAPDASRPPLGAFPPPELLRPGGPRPPLHSSGPPPPPGFQHHGPRTQNGPPGPPEGGMPPQAHNVPPHPGAAARPPLPPPPPGFAHHMPPPMGPHPPGMWPPGGPIPPMGPPPPFGPYGMPPPFPPGPHMPMMPGPPGFGHGPMGHMPPAYGMPEMHPYGPPYGPPPPYGMPMSGPGGPPPPLPFAPHHPPGGYPPHPHPHPHMPMLAAGGMGGPGMPAHHHPPPSHGPHHHHHHPDHNHSHHPQLQPPQQLAQRAQPKQQAPGAGSPAAQGAGSDGRPLPRADPSPAGPAAAAPAAPAPAAQGPAEPQGPRKGVTWTLEELERQFEMMAASASASEQEETGRPRAPADTAPAGTAPAGSSAGPEHAAAGNGEVERRGRPPRQHQHQHQHQQRPQKHQQPGATRGRHGAGEGLPAAEQLREAMASGMDGGDDEASFYDSFAAGGGSATRGGAGAAAQQTLQRPAPAAKPPVGSDDGTRRVTLDPATAAYVRRLLPRSAAKYWMQRYSLFSRFDSSVQLDTEGWWSVTPEVLAAHQAVRCRELCARRLVALDACCGCGGNVIQMAGVFPVVMGVEISERRVEMARHNAAVYEVSHKCQFLCADFFQVAPDLKVDVLFMSPPWGGPKYQHVNTFDVFYPLVGFNRSLLRLLDVTLDCVRGQDGVVAAFLPRNTDLTQLAAVVPEHAVWEVERAYVNNKLKGITVYCHPGRHRAPQEPNVRLQAEAEFPAAAAAAAAAASVAAAVAGLALEPLAVEA